MKRKYLFSIVILISFCLNSLIARIRTTVLPVAGFEKRIKKAVEDVYAHSVMACEGITKVLTEKVAIGYMTEEEDIGIAKRILREKAIRIFKLKLK